MQPFVRSLSIVAILLLGVAPATTFDLRGDGSAWHASVEKRVVGTGNGMTFYQWSIALYDGETLAYESPRDGGPLATVEKAHGAAMWFPVQSASIVGASALMDGMAQQLVVESHETGADCGVATITVFRYDDTIQKVVPAITVRNACDLSAAVHGTLVQLYGPYYGPKAALCCPTQSHSTATLVYRNGRWIETPRYFTLYPNAFPR